MSDDTSRGHGEGQTAVEASVVVCCPWCGGVAVKLGGHGHEPRCAKIQADDRLRP